MRRARPSTWLSAANADLDKDTILERALRYQVLVIGEAASSVSEDVRSQASDIPGRTSSGCGMLSCTAMT